MATDPKPRRANDRLILDVLYRRYRRRFKTRLKKHLPDAQQAEDCVHEAFTRAAEYGDLADVRWLRAYLSCIVQNVRNTVARFQKSEREVLTVSSDQAEHAAEHPFRVTIEMTEAECEAELARLVTLLPGRRGLVFRLSLEGYSYREIALQLGISEAVVGQDLLHAREDIEEMMNPCGGAAHDEKH